MNTTTAVTTTTTVCGQCGIEEKKLLHNVRLRGNFRRLCTTCVLRLHPQCFCPACFGVYDRSPPEDAFVCYKCYSSSHSNCVSLAGVATGVIAGPTGVISGPVGVARGPTPCASCLNPKLLVLCLERGGESGRGIDKDAARLLLCAGKIAAMSMNKAEVAATMEADRRAKEAAFTKKRAQEALDHVVKLMVKEKKNKSVVVESNRKVLNKDNKVVDSSEVVEAFNAVELESGNGMEVDGKDPGLVIDSVVENGGVDGEKVCKGENEGVEENGVVNPS